MQGLYGVYRDNPGPRPMPSKAPCKRPLGPPLAAARILLARSSSSGQARGEAEVTRNLYPLSETAAYRRGTQEAKSTSRNHKILKALSFWTEEQTQRVGPFPGRFCGTRGRDLWVSGQSRTVGQGGARSGGDTDTARAQER